MTRRQAWNEPKQTKQSCWPSFFSCFKKPKVEVIRLETIKEEPPQKFETLTEIEVLQRQMEIFRSMAKAER